MAAIQERNGSWRALFRYQGQQHAVTIGRVPKHEAVQWKGKVEHLLMRLRQNLLELPSGMPITEFVLRDGKPVTKASQTASTTFGQLHDAYIAARSNGSLEANTLATIELHLGHIEKTLGKHFLLDGLSLKHLQEHVTRRMNDPVKAMEEKKRRLPERERKKFVVRKISATTIKKEIVSFRAAWLWGVRAGLVKGEFPSVGLSYPKVDEKPPFMTWSEIDRRIRAGGDAATLWECLYLDADQIAELLNWLKAKPCRPWVYPILVMAAHAGVRRSELLRVTAQDVNLAERIITVHEKKKARGRRTTRSVPISDLLHDALLPLMDGRKYLFGDGQKPLSANHAKLTFRRVFRKSKWSVVRGFHVFRHSFISILASKNIDQRIIDDFVGHQTEEQRRRYRHLFPQVTRAAIAQAFG
ncbi:MAG TPA: tyrosine-type recombinase/integrase [Pirellulales bacterium]|nr:tyrosine-type recombinase/integrase [Pirellulales bacterium]